MHPPVHEHQHKHAHNHQTCTYTVPDNGFGDVWSYGPALNAQDRGSSPDGSLGRFSDFFGHQKDAERRGSARPKGRWMSRTRHYTSEK